MFLPDWDWDWEGLAAVVSAEVAIAEAKSLVEKLSGVVRPPLLLLLLLLLFETPLPPISCTSNAFVEISLSSCESTCLLDKFSLCGAVFDTDDTDELVVVVVIVDLE